MTRDDQAEQREQASSVGQCELCDSKAQTTLSIRGPLYVPRAAVSIAGGIQPETLQRALGQVYCDNGLAARILLACPPRRPKRWTEADIDPVIVADITNVFDRLYDLRPIAGDNDEPSPVIVRLTPEGKRKWIDFYNTHAEEHTELTGDLSSVWSKLEAYAARLALVVHFVRWAAGDPTLRDPDAVDKASVRVGVELCRWFAHEARRVYPILDESREGRDRRQLVELIQRRGGSVTARDLMRSSRRFKTTSEAESALNELVNAGAGQWKHHEPGSKGGKPTTRFTLVDTVDVDNTPAGAPVKGGIVNVDTVDTTDGDWGEL